MTHLIASIAGDSIVEVRDSIGRAVEAGADFVELRVDLMEDVSDEDLLLLRENAPPSVPIILTIRSASEGGDWDGPDNDRIARLIDLAPIADYIDIEWETWQRSANIRQKIGLALGRHEGTEPQRHDGEGQRRLILSRHDLRGRPASLHSDLLAMSSTPQCDVIKIAWRARTSRDNFEAFELMRTAVKPIIAICMGEEGIASRVLAKKFGAFATFAAIAAGHETAAGQLSIEQFKKTYRWDKINPSTKIYGLIGDPVSQSLGPILHNAAFEHLAHDAVYLPFKVSPGYESFKAFMVEVLAHPWIDFAGFSFTSPHKENAMRFLVEAGGELGSFTEVMQSVNTFTLNEGRLLSGDNWDIPAIRSSLKLALQVDTMRGLNVAVLGAGGLGRAVAAALAMLDANVTIYNRTNERARQVAESIVQNPAMKHSARSCQWAPWEDRVHPQTDVIVQCTSVGMLPQSDQTPLPKERFSPGMVVMDTIYRPRETRFLSEARLAGCRTVSGLELFLFQVRGQLITWTDQVIELDQLRAWVDEYA